MSVKINVDVQDLILFKLMVFVIRHVASINIKLLTKIVNVFLDSQKSKKKMVVSKKSIVQNQMKLLTNQDMNAFAKMDSKEILRLKIVFLSVQ